jgi:hypothetical protein
MMSCVGTPLDINRPLRTRDGRRARYIANDRPTVMGGYAYPLRVSVEHPNEPGAWTEWDYMLDGRWKSNDPDNHNDLIYAED